MSGPQGNIATGMIMSLKNSNDSIGNRTRDLPFCNVVPYPLRHRAQAMQANSHNFCLLNDSKYFYQSSHVDKKIKALSFY
jgi:hypothetical protein